MKRTIVVRRLAEDHLAESYERYERQLPGLGRDFLRRFDVVQQRLGLFAESFPIAFLDYRRALLNRFPFGVFVIEGDFVVVAAV